MFMTVVAGNLNAPQAVALPDLARLFVEQPLIDNAILARNTAHLASAAF